MIKVLTGLGLATIASTIAICATNDNSKWQFSNLDSSNSVTEEAHLDKNDESYSMSLNNELNLVRGEKITKDDVVVFNYSLLKKDLNNSSCKDMSYSLLNKYKATIKHISLNDDNTINIEYEGNDDDQFCGVISKDKLKDNNFAFVTGTYNNGTKNYVEKTQLEFEEEYINNASRPTWNNAKTVLNIAGNIALMCIGYSAGSPATLAGGILGFCNTAFDFLNTDAITNAQVLEHVKAIEKQLTELDEKIDKNTEMLADETIRVGANVDQALLGQQNQDIQAFSTDYNNPLENYLRMIGDYTSVKLSEYVKSNHTLTLNYRVNDEGVLDLVPMTSEALDTDTKVTLELNDFTKSLEFLKLNNGVVDKGFTDYLLADVMNALENLELPEGITKEMVQKDVMATIYDGFLDEYFAGNTKEVSELKNMVINYANRITGKDGKSILNTYISRLKYMYNFAGEGKNSLTDVFASLLSNLNTYATLAQFACTHAKVRQADLGEAYEAAAKVLTNCNDEKNKVKDTYSYTLGCNVDGSMFRAKWSAYYTNKGNHPTFSANLSFSIYGSNGFASATDISKYNMLTENEIKRLVTRYGILFSEGLTDKNTVLDYFTETKVIDKTVTDTYYELVKKNYIPKDNGRFMTSLNVRDLTDNDTNIYMYFNDKGGDEKTDYFSTDWKGNYKSANDGKYWSGKVAESTFLSVEDGSLMNNKRLCSYARYEESHGYWFHDEFWAFVDNLSYSWFFMLYKA